MDNREANFSNHPPACTCVDCVRRRKQEAIEGIRREQNLPPAVLDHVAPIQSRPQETEVKPMKKVRRFSLVKLVINVLIVASFIGIIFVGYQAFTHKMHPVAGTIWFIVSVVVFISLIKLTNSRRYNWHTPSFTLTFWSLFGIALVATFAGIQPLSHYKDELFNKISHSVGTGNSMAQTALPISKITSPVNQTWSHTGYIQNTITGNNFTSIIFQDGFSVMLVGALRQELLPPIGAKFEIKYQYDPGQGGNVLTSLLPKP